MYDVELQTEVFGYLFLECIVGQTLVCVSYYGAACHAVRHIFSFNI